MLTYQCISIGMTSSIGDVSILVIELNLNFCVCLNCAITQLMLVKLCNMYGMPVLVCPP